MLVNKTIIEKLSEGVFSIKLENVPDNVLTIAKRCIIDIWGVTFAGSSTISAQKIFNFALKNYGSGNCNILGYRNSLNASGASFVNGTSAHALDFDDNCYAGVVHGSAVVFPAVLAASQQIEANGQDFLRGFITGLEVEFAIAKGLSNSIYDRGWWTTSLLGSIGSAAGVSSVLKLNVEQTSNAMALAISGVGAIRAIRGTNAKHFYSGQAAERGVSACLLAKNGFTGPIDVFEDRNGITKILNNGIFNNNEIQYLGKKFSLFKPGVDIKKYPVCFASHSAIDAIKKILSTNNINPNDVKFIKCTIPEIVASNLTYSNPKTVAQAQFSLEYAIASIMHLGEITLENLNQETVMNPKLRKYFSIIEIKVSDVPENENSTDYICPEWANIELETKNRNYYKAFIGSPIGSSRKPMSEDTLFAKFQSCIKYSDQTKNAETLYKDLRDVENLENLSALF